MVLAASVASCLAGSVTPASAQGPHGSLPEGLTCRNCHDVPNFVPALEDKDFDHGEVVGFNLTGAHASVDCRQCHLDLRFGALDVVPEDCGSCHADLHQASFVDPCVTCHQPTSFRDVSGLDVHARTTFPLVGAHLQITCEACHATDEAGGAFAAQDTDCVACHQADYESAPAVDHVAFDFSTECTGCHSVLGFADGLSFPHNPGGGFALSGPHPSLGCESCHTVPGLTPLFAAAGSEDCLTCHQADYTAQHAGSSFSTTCLTCHSGDAWEDPDVDHDAVAGFTLLAPHDGLDCSACHDGTAFTLRFPVPTDSDDCVACHQVDYDGQHGGTSVPTTCLTCHERSAWPGAADHETLSGGFELLGAHTFAECTACHVPGTFALQFPVPSSPEDCLACHRAEYEVGHGGVGSTNCLVCHDRTTWSKSSLPVVPQQHIGVRRAP